MQTATRRDFLILGSAAAAMAATPGAWARGLLGTVRLGAAETFFPWSELAPGVHATVDAALGGNCMAITSAGKGLLIDTKYPAFAAGLVREARAFGAEITRVINTHHHGDHTGGNAVLKDRVEIIAHVKAADRIGAQLDSYVQGARGGPSMVGRMARERDAVEEVLEEAQAAAEACEDWNERTAVPDTTIMQWPHPMTVGEVKLVVHHFGAGHTDNDMVIQLPEQNVIHTGDLCFNGLHSFFDPSAGVTCRGWSDVIGKVIELCDSETKVVPGHGEVGTREALIRQRDYLDALWENVGAAIKDGKTKEEAAQMTWDFMDGLGFDQIRPRAIGAVYDEIQAAD